MFCWFLLSKLEDICKNIMYQYKNLHNPLFLYPSDGPNLLHIGQKLLSSANYRSWRRVMEMHLSTNYKLEFVLGTLAKSVDDLIKVAQLETCKNSAIC